MERLLDELVEGAWDWDLQRRVVRHNATWCEMLGVGPELREHRIEDYWRFVHHDDAARVRDGVDAALRGNGRLRHEYRMVRSDGAVLWVVDRGAVIERASNGRPLRMVGSLLDVTAERRRLDDQRQAAQRLRLALDAGELGLWDWSVGSGQLVVDERWRTMLGLPRDHPVTSIDEWASRVHPEDAPKLGEIVKHVIEPSDGTDFSVEVRARHADGHWVWVLDQGMVAQRDADGRPLRVIGTHQDISERKATARLLEQQRAQLQTVIDTAMDAIVTVDASLRVVMFNHAAERMFRVRAADVIGDSFDRFMPTGMRGGAHERRMEAFIASGRRTRVIASHDGDSVAVRADGSTFPVEASVSRSGQGAELLVTAIIRDVTEVARARDAILQKERAEQASAAKSEFLSRVSHELRTPLNAILGFADLMQDAEAAALQHHLGHLRRAGHRLLDLVNDLLDLGRIEAGRTDLKIVPTDVFRTVAQVSQLVGAEAQRRRVSLIVDAVDDQRAVLADARALDQVLLNLMSNAVKFSPEGGTVRLCVEHGLDDLTRISVLDEGPGIPASRFGDLFKPYSRLETGSAAKVPGTGLGLAIAHGLARQMGGDLIPGVAPGGGTCMCLCLAAVASAPSAALSNGPGTPTGQPTANRETATAPQRRLTAGRALVVEDDPTSAVLLQHVFEAAGGWSVDVAHTVPEALDRLGADPFDLVLADLNVAGEDGMRVIEAANSLPRRASMCVVAVTADAMPGQAARVRASGADGYWSKPIDVVGVRSFLQSDPDLWRSRLGSGSLA